MEERNFIYITVCHPKKKQCLDALLILDVERGVGLSVFGFHAAQFLPICPAVALLLVLEGLDLLPDPLPLCEVALEELDEGEAAPAEEEAEVAADVCDEVGDRLLGVEHVHLEQLLELKLERLDHKRK